MIGAMAHTMCGPPDYTRAPAEPSDFRSRIERLVAFLSRGIPRAPAAIRKDRGEPMRWLWILMLAAACAWAADDDAARAPLQLSLKRAVEMATSPEGNANIQLAGRGAEAGAGAVAEARAALLPDVESSVSDQSRTENLAALGITVQSPPDSGLSDSRRSWGRSPPWTRASRARRASSISAPSGASRPRKAGVAAARSDAENTGGAGGRAGGARLPGGGQGRCRRGDRAGQRDAFAGAADAGRERERRRAPGPASKSRAPKCSWPTTGSICWWRRTPGAARICGCCAPWACGWIPNWS